MLFDDPNMPQTDMPAGDGPADVSTDAPSEEASA